MATIFVDLLMDNGKIIALEYNDKYEDEFISYLLISIERGDSWAVSRFDGTRAEYMGINIERVNCSKVIGML